MNKPFRATPVSLLRNVILCAFIVWAFQACKKTDAVTSLTSHESGQSTQKNFSNLPQMDLALVASGFTSPLGVVPSPDNSGRLFVIDQTGKIFIIGRDGVLMPVPFLDITSKVVPLRPGFDERGLLGLAFHPGYAENGRFYVYYNALRRMLPYDNTIRLAEYSVSPNPDLANPASERLLFQLDDPQFNHNGGTIAFGPDDYLYIAIGDGGGANDVGFGHVEDWYKVNAGGNGQDIEANLFGNILRIDVDNGSPYGIPADNPFVGQPGLDEVWAFGFRNPYRFSFDTEASKDLIVGDVGQFLYEEVDVVRKGGNYGWNVREGFHCFSTATPRQSLPDCPNRDSAGNKLIDPVLEMVNGQAPDSIKGPRSISVIGGHVYRGETIHRLKGEYVFGSYSRANNQPRTGELYVAHRTGSANWPFQKLALKSFPDHLGQFLKGFGQDMQGEIYVTTSDIAGPTGTTGKVYKLVPAQ